MPRSAAVLLALVTILALLGAACSEGEPVPTVPPADAAPPAGDGDALPDAGGADTTPADPGTETPDAVPEPAVEDNTAELAVLREQAAALNRKIDELTATLEGIGDVDALKSQIAKLRKAAASPMGGAVANVKQEIAKIEAQIAEWDAATNARQAVSRELAEVEAAIREIEGE